MHTDTAYLKRRRQTWYFQLSVPVDVQAKLAEARGADRPVKVIVETLNTTDKAEAQRKRVDYLARYHELFDNLRGKRRLTMAEIEQAAEATMRRELEERHKAAERGTPRSSGGDTDASLVDRELGGLDVERDELLAALRDGDMSPARVLAEAVIADKGATISEGSTEWRELCGSQLRAKLAAVEGRIAYLNGRPYEALRPFTTPRIDPVTLVARSPAVTRKPVIRDMTGDKLDVVMQRYLDERTRDPTARITEQTRLQAEATFRLFRDHVDNASVQAVTREDAVGFVDQLARLHPMWGKRSESKGLSLAALLERFGDQDEKLTNKTLNRHTTALSAFFKWAKKRSLYTGENPFSGLLRNVGRQSLRGYLPYTEDELRKFVTAPLLKDTTYAERVRPKNLEKFRIALMWLPLIGMFTGMRSGEIASLDVVDVAEQDGIPDFDITAAKTEAGVRKVPVHSELLKMGFLEYRDHAARHHSGRLFPCLRPGGRDGKPNHYFTSRFPDYRRETLGITRDRLAFHSFRHNIGTALERAQVPESEAVKILGHEELSMSYGVYSVGVTISHLRDIVEKIAYPGLDFEHLRP